MHSRFFPCGRSPIFFQAPLQRLNFYFPLELWNGDLKREYRINFAAIHCGTENAMPNMDDGFCSEFPLSVPCYKTGLAVIENNSWKIFDEKWFKIGKKQHE